MIYYVKALGIKQVQTRFTRMSEAAIDATPAMESLAVTTMDIIRRVFQSQGRRGGGSWKRDSPGWLAYKVRQGLDPRIGYSSGDLVSSLTNPDDPNQLLEILPNSMALGSKLPYAGTQQEHRPVRFTAGDRMLMRSQVRNYLLDAWRNGLSAT